MAEVLVVLEVPEVLEAPTQEQDLVGAASLWEHLPAKRPLTVSRSCQDLSKELPLYITMRIWE